MNKLRLVISAKNIKSSFISLAIGISSILLPVSVMAAERIAFSFPPLGQFKIKVADLEALTTEGEVSPELAYYLDRLPPEQQAKLPELLSTPLELNPLTITKFSNSSIGEAVIKNFGKGIRVNPQLNGFYALRSAIIAAAFDEEGLTMMNLLHRFPAETIHLDLQVLTQYIKQGTVLSENREAIAKTWFEDQPQNYALKNNAASNQQPQPSNLEVLGTYQWQKETLRYRNPRRVKPGYFDLYQPKTNQTVPLIVISHGLASNRQTFAYLGRHLASHGFAVAVVEHNDISLEKFDRFLSGTTKFPEPNNLIEQPLDIKYVIDRLEQNSAIDTQQVGILGQSFGGYTSLAVAGGELIADAAATDCEAENYHEVFLDLSSLAKCTFNRLNIPRIKLRDPRIKAVVAINPMSKIFGRAGMSSIEVPTMIISGTNDLIMPPVAEQIKPFSWLDEDLAKYLVLVQPGTHFSFLQEGLGVLPVPDAVVGPSPTSAHPILKQISTAFFQAHLNQQLEYQAYLQNDRLPGDFKLETNQDLKNAFELSIIRSLTQSQLQDMIVP